MALQELWWKIRSSFRSRKALDSILLATPDPQALLRKRVHWFFDLLAWIRHEGEVKHEMDFNTGVPQAARVRYLLQVLDRQPDWKLKVSRLLRSIIRDTRGLDLFLETGISSEDSFAGEFFKRLSFKTLPQPPQDQELSFLFSENFRNRRDIEWIRLLDKSTFERLQALFLENETVSEIGWNSLKEDAEKALLLLSFYAQGLGMKSEIRKRLPRFGIEDFPFYRLPKSIEKLLKEQDPDMKNVLSHQVEKVIEECLAAITEVQQHMDEYGVSIHLVYQLEKMERYLQRIRYLNFILQQKAMDPVILSSFVESLIYENSQRRSIRALFASNFSLLARKIVERSADTGEHYIARTHKEHRHHFLSSLGGGLITAFTTVLKILISKLGLSDFYSGVAASLNYSVSFLFIQFAHFTLGTKQPALTAPALAAKMQHIHREGALENLTDEIIHIIRSQFVAVIGNIVGVLPLTIAMGLIVQWGIGFEMVSVEKAHHILQDFSILGPTPLFAAFTGILLWLSSLISGWADNWFVYHRMHQALAHHRRLGLIFGETTMRKFALFLKKNTAAIAANVSLGFLLGLTPVVLHFFGIGLDVRHVTLSSGTLSAAMLSLPTSAFHEWDFWLAVMGIMSMGVLNILVSFSLALFLAIRARQIQAPERSLLYRSVLKKVLRRPLVLFFPSN